MSRDRPISSNERALFREAVKDVRPLRADRPEPDGPKPPPVPRQRERDDAQVLKDMLSDAVDPAELETGEELVFARPGLQHSVLRKLRRGQFSVEAELDLHGMTVVEARQALAEFLQARPGRCVRIIHGKGNSSAGRLPVLKGKVNHWLRQRREVLAFCSARPVDGGTGALYVLLARKR